MAGILPHLSLFYFLILSESAGILPRLYMKSAFYEYLRTFTLRRAGILPRLCYIDW